MAYPRPFLRWQAVAAALAALCAAAPARPAGAQPRPAGLAWARCAQAAAFDCATARAALDRSRPGGRTIALAVIRHRAEDPAHRAGTLFFNPGGPGVAGTSALPQMYRLLPRELRRRFDIVSWDPRGVGRSTAVRCFATAAEAAAWSARLPSFPVTPKERTGWIAAQADLGRRCEQRDPELLRHISTADSADDLDMLRAATGEQKVNYLGISYGTYLGAVYANLHPDRVRALVLDGNVDPQAWVDARSPLSTFLRQNSDLGSYRALGGFLDLCGRAGPQACPFAAAGPAATRSKFAGLLQRLRQRPVGPFTYSAVVGAVTQSLYTVHPGWTILARALQDLWLGRLPAQGAAAVRGPYRPVAYPGFEQLPAILCAESSDPRDPARFAALEQFSRARAGDLGADWTWTNEVCATWPARAAHSYTGPWGRSKAAVLAIGTTTDPATPYGNSQAMVRRLGRARLLTVAGYGHSVLLNPSRCAARWEAGYLLTLTLPPAGLVCRQDAPPFGALPFGALSTGARREAVPGAVPPWRGLPWSGRNAAFPAWQPLRLALRPALRSALRRSALRLALRRPAGCAARGAAEGGRRSVSPASCAARRAGR